MAAVTVLKLEAPAGEVSITTWPFTSAVIQNEFPALTIVPLPEKVQREEWETTLRAQACVSEGPSSSAGGFAASLCAP